MGLFEHIEGDIFSKGLEGMGRDRKSRGNRREREKGGWGI